MKKEEFVKLGIDEETAKKCEIASQEELKGYIPKTRFDEVNNEKKTLETTLAERNSQFETLKNSTGDVESLKQQIATLQADNQKKDEAHATEIKKLKVDSAVDAAIVSAKGKNAKAIKALLNLENAELVDDGTIKGLAEQIEALQKSDEYLFEAKESKKTNVKGAKPGEAGNEDDDKKVDTSKMTYTELAAYLAENPEAKVD